MHEGSFLHGRKIIINKITKKKVTDRGGYQNGSATLKHGSSIQQGASL